MMPLDAVYIEPRADVRHFLAQGRGRGRDRVEMR